MTTLKLKETADDISISLLTVDEDILKLMPLIREELTELNANPDKVDWEKILGVMYACKIRGAIFKAENSSGEIVGAIALTQQDSFWSKDTSLCNVLLYVKPECRKSGLGLGLIRKAKQYAIESEKELNIFVDSDIDLERKDKMFKACGFTLRGGTYRFV